MTHDRACTFVGAALALAYLSGALSGGALIRGAYRAGSAAGDWLANRIEIGRVL